MVEGFRSIRNLEVTFGDVNLVTGANGCGKSNLFDAFRLVKAAVEGRLAQATADQGGMASILWAGPRDKGPVRLKLTVVAEPYEYRLELGLRPASEFPLFPLDPQIKSEVVKLAGRTMMDRGTSVAKIRGLEGPWELRHDLVDSESVFSQVRDAERYPFLVMLQDLVRRWTFYHEFRTDQGSPIRRPALPTYSPRLAEDGSNLAPALYVISRHGEIDRMTAILAAALPNTTFRFGGESIAALTPGIERAIETREFSDGTLKFLCLVAACFSTRPAPIVAFNEPEVSLHDSCLTPLADALVHASVHSQLWITTHSEPLARALTDRIGCDPIRLSKVEGETVLSGRSRRRGYRRDEDDADSQEE